jgi:hypothetical protein
VQARTQNQTRGTLINGRLIAAYAQKMVETGKSSENPIPSALRNTAWKKMNGLQGSDPAKLAKALIQLAS